MTNVRILIPVRPLHDGKQRLAPVLSSSQRHALNARFLQHTLQVATAVLPAAHCIVISRCEQLLADARARGMQAVHEHASHGLNGALSQGAQVACAQGADAVLSLSCDLPFLRTDDLHAMLRDHTPRSVRIATDACGQGTNALLMSPPLAIEYRYGIGSRLAHEHAAHAVGLRVECLRRPGLAHDIDTPGDLARFLPSPWPLLPRIGHTTASTDATYLRQDYVSAA